MSTELRLLTVPHKLLRTRCDESFTIPEDLIPLMFKLMREKNGLGLAAPQIGVNARLFVTYWGEVFCDPVIDNLSHPAFVNEGCLSVPDHLATVRRYLDIKVGHRNYTGLQAVVIQHENDHLDGITIATADHDPGSKDDFEPENLL